MPTIWATIFIVILLSVVMHGVTVTPVMRWIDRARGVDSMRPTRPAEETG